MFHLPVEEDQLTVDVHLWVTLDLEGAAVVIAECPNGTGPDVPPVLMPVRYRVEVQLNRGPDQGEAGGIERVGNQGVELGTRSFGRSRPESTMTVPWANLRPAVIEEPST